MITLLLIREDTEKLGNYNIPINKLKGNSILACRIVSSDIRNSKAFNMFKTIERVRICMKNNTFLETHQFFILFNRKIKKTSDDSENGTSLSQYGRRCPSLV